MVKLKPILDGMYNVHCIRHDIFEFPRLLHTCIYMIYTHASHQQVDPLSPIFLDSFARVRFSGKPPARVMALSNAQLTTRAKESTKT